MQINGPNKSDFFIFFKNKTMGKTISDGEKLVQLTLNRKYQELEAKDKQIAQLQRELDCLKLQLKEDKETISQLCHQLSNLFLKQKQNAN